MQLRDTPEEAAFRAELREWLAENVPKLPPEPDHTDWPARRAYESAWQALLFGFLGSALGSRTNRRSSASSGFVLTVVCIIIYWILYVAANNMALKMVVPPAVALWMPDTLFLLLTVWAWRHHSNA